MSEIYKGEQQKRHRIYVSFILACGVFKGCNTLLWKLICYMTFEFSRISRTNLTPAEYLKRYFLNHHVCFFLEQATDRQIDILF